MTVRAGTLLEGRYRLGRRIGAGAAGEVWEASDTRTLGLVAVKVLHHELAGDAEVRERFVIEARGAALIRHPNVVRVFEHGVIEGQPYMVMEMCDGETLDAVIQSRGAVGVGYACELVTQVLGALDAAHALGIVHRDLKPANISVLHARPDQPVIKVLDFGIAKGVHGDGATEEHGRLFGTPSYMAPEQAAGGVVDARADVYAAGAILYELLTGKPPFSGANATEVIARVLALPPKPLRAFDRSLPATLDGVLRRALAKDPSDRPQSAEELASLLEPYLPPPAAREPLTSFGDRESLEPLLLVQKAPASVAPVSSRRPMLELVVSDSSFPPPVDDE